MFKTKKRDNDSTWKKKRYQNFFLKYYFNDKRFNNSHLFTKTEIINIKCGNYLQNPELMKRSCF